MVMKTDIELKQDVIAELNWEPTVIGGVIAASNNPKIDVAVMNGVVTLSGEVDSYAKKWAAYQTTRRVIGVKEVVEILRLNCLGLLNSRTKKLAEMRYMQSA